MVSSTCDDEKLAEGSPPAIKERTLSYYFHLPIDDISSPPPQHHLKSTSFTESKRARHQAHSTKQWRPLLVDIGADTRPPAPLSWLSTLLSGRKRTHTSFRHGCVDEGKLGEPFCTAATAPSPSLDWEAPRASTWEQLSSWEKPTWDLSTAEEHRRASESEHDNQHPTIVLQQQAGAKVVDPLMEKKQESSRRGQLAWMKNLLAMKWAMKLRRTLTKKRVAEQGRGDGEDDQIDRESTMSAASRGSDYSQVHICGSLRAGQDRVFHSQRELGESWSSHYSPLLQSKANLKPIKVRPPAHVTREENRLLRFYLTPTRGIKFGSKRPRSHHPLIPPLQVA